MGLKKHALLLWVICLFALVPTKLFASHAVGADLKYECLGNNQYLVTLNFYRDCASSVSGPSVGNYNTIYYTNTCTGQTYSKTVTVVSRTEASDVCPAQAGQTTCHGGNLPGIELWVCTATITLPSQCADWVISYNMNARNSAITNLNGPGSYDLYVEAHLNNTNGLCDNSPYFTTKPVPYDCSGTQKFYSHGGVDVDGDSLVYSLIQPKGSRTSTVPYKAGYSATNPMRVTGTFQFNTATGQMTYTPNGVQQAVVDVLVQEYRQINGVWVLIGSTMRDMQIVVLNCSNAPPVVSGINGSPPSNPSNFQTNICSGNQLCFDVDFTDPVVTNFVTATLNAGIPGSTFTITGNGTTHAIGHFCWTPTLADVGTHNFTVAITNNACPIPGSTSSTFTVVVAPSSYSLGFTKTNLRCAGDNNGTARVDIVGAISPVFAWSNGQSTQSITGLAAGFYKVTVNDLGGCGTVDSVEIQSPPPILDSLGMVPTQCNGFVNGEAFIAKVSGGGSSVSNHFTHVWSVAIPSTTADTIKPLPSGTYFITFTDDSGCTKKDSVFVTQPGPIVIVSNASSTSNYNGSAISCNGKADGEITLSVTGGTPPFTYQWGANANGQTSAVINNLGPDTYKVTITDANGCNDVAQKTITEPPVVVAHDSVIKAYHGSDVSCFGLTDGRDSIWASGGTGTLQYSLNGGPFQTSNVFTGLGQSSITIAVKDANGCTVNLNNTVHQPTQLLATAVSVGTSASGTSISCFGGTDGRAGVQATGGTKGYYYTWDDPYHQIADVARDLTAGTYNVTVTDTNGCSATSSVTLTQPTQLHASHTSQDVKCFGGTDGSITELPTGGNTPYDYLWNTPGADITQTVNGLSANTQYIVTITDFNECSINDTITLTQPTQLNVTNLVTSNYNGRQISCAGASDGELTANATGGTGPYSYVWPPIVSGMGTTAILGNQPAGTHTVIVTDANNCTVTASNILSDPPTLTIKDSVIKAYHGFDISCAGLNDGRDSITVTGGTIPYQYASAVGGPYQVSNVVNNLAQGLYTIEAKDANGCIISKQILVNEPTAVTASILAGTSHNGANISCAGLSDGDATVTPSGGASGFTYLWSANNQTTQQATNLAQGNYSVTVKDANGCSITKTVPLVDPAKLLATTLSSTDALCNGSADGTAGIDVTGGTGAYTYQWGGGVTQNAATVNTLTAGNYQVSVRDANNCLATTPVNISQPSVVVAWDSIVSDYHGKSISCNLAKDGAAIARGSGGTPPYTFNWTPGMGNGVGGAFVANVGDGNYSLTVTDAHGCKGTATITFVQPTPVTAQPTIQSKYGAHAPFYDIRCNGESNGAAFFTPSGGNGNYTYQWTNDGNTSPSRSSLSAGTYDVVVTDQNGCTSTSTVTLREPAPITVQTLDGKVSCNGLSDGALTANASGGATDFTYVWGTLPAQTGPTANGLSATLNGGEYFVTVTDQNGCQTTSKANVTEPPVLTAQVSKQDPTCHQGPDGKVEALAQGGTPNYQYHWGGPTTGDGAELRGVLAGIYTLTAVDNNGCSTLSTITIAEPPADSTTAVPTLDTVNLGQGTELITTYLTTVPGAVSYSWEPATGLSCNNCAQPTASPLETTVYTLKMTDANGCTAYATAKVNVSESRILFVPNAFSPNGDNNNDLFMVYGPGITKLEFKVFNRWGAEVFESNDIEKGWDGTYKGETLPTDIFVYTVKATYLDNTEKTAKGSVTLFR